MLRDLVNRIIKPTDRTTQVLLFLIIAVATYLRLHRLTFQSLWLDELYTMRECDPAISWKESYNMVMAFEWKTPFYYLALKFFFGLFGYTPYAARFFSVIGGILGVWAMYVLGREMMSKRTGLVAAFFCAINYFHIFYSQEARGYSFLFLFNVWSFVFFLRYAKVPTLKNAAYTGLFGLLAVYMHPFALLTLICQVLLFVLFLITRHTANRKNVALIFAVVPVIAIAGLLPFIKLFTSAADQTSSWMSMPGWDFFIDYLQKFFYKSDYTWPVVLFLTACFLFFIFRPRPKKQSTGEFSRLETFLILIVWLTVVFAVPYIRCRVTGVAVLNERYLINALPAVLLIISLGISELEQKWLRTILVLVFTASTMNDLFLLKRYYFVTTKTQFREMTRFIGDNDKNGLPVINQSSGWQQAYYLQHFGMRNAIYYSRRQQLLDSIITQASVGVDQHGFWLAGAHGEPLPPKGVEKGLEANFVETLSGFFPEAWARLYTPATQYGSRVIAGNALKLFPSATEQNDGEVVTVLINGTTTHCEKKNLKAGSYFIYALAKGNPCNETMPAIDVFAGDCRIGSFSTTKHFQLSSPIRLELALDTVADIRFKLNNTSACNNNAPQMAFIKTIYLFGK